MGAPSSSATVCATVQGGARRRDIRVEATWVDSKGITRRKFKYTPDVIEKPVERDVYAGRRGRGRSSRELIAARRDVLYVRVDRCPQCGGLLEYEPMYARCRFGCGRLWVIIGALASAQLAFERCFTEHPEDVVFQRGKRGRR